MPRPVTTTQAGRKSSASPQTQDTDLEELVPGPSCLTQTQWMEMLAVEQTEEVVAETMSHLLSQVIDACYKVDLNQQLTPFTATWVKDCLVQIVEQHFLCRDEGDGPEDILTDDSEPVPADPDAWAQGCVPLIIPSPPLQPILPKDTVQKEAEPEVQAESSLMPQPDISLKLPAKKTNLKPVVDNMNKLKCNSFPPPKTDLKKSTQGPIRSRVKFLPPLSYSTEKKSLKSENTTPSFNNASASLQSQPIQKLDPTSLPEHCVFPKFEIVDSISNSRQRKTREQKYKKQETTWTAQTDDARPKSKHEGLVTTRPLRLHAMTLAKGVTLSNTIDVDMPSSSRQQTPPTVKLKPIRNDPTPVRFSVEQFALDPHVQVTPLSPS